MARKLSRREFLRNAAGAAAGLGALQVLAACAPASAPQPATVAPAAAPTTAPAVVGQGGGAAPTQSVSSVGAANATTTLNIWTGYPELEPFYKAVGADFIKTHPDVKIQVLSTTLREFEAKLMAAMPTGTGPDIFDVEPNLSPKLVEGQFIAPNPADVEAIVKSNAYTKFVQDYMSFGGKTYGIPLMDGSLASLFYNKTMFKDAGLDPNKPPTTQQEMMDFARKLTKYDSGGNITVSGQSLRIQGQGSGITEKWWFIAHNLGADPVVQAKDGKNWHNGYNNDAGRAALQYYIDALYKYKVDAPTVPHDADAFETGKTAMFLRESWVIGEVGQKAPTLDYGVAPMPGAVKHDTLTQPAGVYVSKSSKSASLAWEYNKLLTGKDNAIRQIDMTGWLSPNRSVDYGALVQKTPQYAAFVKPPSDLGYYAYPLITPFDEVITKMADRLTAAYLNKSLADNPANVAKAIQDMANETDSVLKQAGMYAAD